MPTMSRLSSLTELFYYRNYKLYMKLMTRCALSGKSEKSINNQSITPSTQMELLTRVVIVVWCSTVVRYTFAREDLVKKPCLNKKCIKTSNPFGITEIEPIAAETRISKFSGKYDDLFNAEVNPANVKKITEVFDNGFYSALCWIEITTITEFKNGSNNAIREYAISFESPSDIPKQYLDKANEVTPEVVPYTIFDQDTKKSEVVNFTTTKVNENFTVRQNRKVLCGSGPIYTKEYFEWLNSNKKKIELRVSPKKQSLVASECKDEQEESDGANTESDVTVRQDNLNNTLEQEETIPKFRVTGAKDLNDSFSTSTVSVSQQADEDPYVVTTQIKLLPNDETTSITVRLGSESFKFSEESTSDNNLHVSPNLNENGDTDEEIVYKMKSGLGTTIGGTSDPSQTENYSINSEKLITSTEGASLSSEEYSSFAASRKLTAKPQLGVTRLGIDDFSFGSTKSDYDYEGKSTTNLHPLAVDKKLRERTTLDFEKFRSDHTIKPEHPKGSTTATVVTNFDNSKDIQSAEYNENPTTLSSTTVTKVPILLDNVNTAKTTESEAFSTEKSASTSSIEEIQRTTKEEAYVTTSLLQNITVSNTHDPLTVTETFFETFFAPKNNSSNATVPNQFSAENHQQWGIPLNETGEKISFRVNILTDHILEGTKNGKVFRNITPLIGVEKKIEFLLKYKNQALETYKKELGYNWDNFMQELILRFFGNRTNVNSNHLININSDGCSNKVENTNAKYAWGIVKNPTPELAYNKFNGLNLGNQFLNSNQKINNHPWVFNNQQRPTAFNKYKHKFDSIHNFTYPSIGKLVSSQNSAILFKNKQPVFRLDNSISAENATGNVVNHSFSGFRHLEKKPTSVMLQKVLNLTKTMFGSSSQHSDNTTNFNMDELTKRNIGNRVNSSLPLASDKVGDEEPVYRVMTPTNVIFQKLKDFHKLAVPKHVSTEKTQSSIKVEVEEKIIENANPGLFNDMFQLISSSFSLN